MQFYKLKKITLFEILCRFKTKCSNKCKIPYIQIILVKMIKVIFNNNTVAYKIKQERIIISLYDTYKSVLILLFISARIKKIKL